MLDLSRSVERRQETLLTCAGRSGWSFCGRGATRGSSKCGPYGKAEPLSSSNLNPTGNGGIAGGGDSDASGLRA